MWDYLCELANSGTLSLTEFYQIEKKAGIAMNKLSSKQIDLESYGFIIPDGNDLNCLG